MLNIYLYIYIFLFKQIEFILYIFPSSKSILMVAFGRFIMLIIIKKYLKNLKNAQTIEIYKKSYIKDKGIPTI